MSKITPETLIQQGEVWFNEVKEALLSLESTLDQPLIPQSDASDNPKNKKQRAALKKSIQNGEKWFAGFKKILPPSESALIQNGETWFSEVKKALSISFDADAVIQKLKGMNRIAAGNFLEEQLNAEQVGDLLRKLGGTSDDAKRPKEKKIEAILYRLFDFEAGQKIVEDVASGKISGQNN